MVLELFLFKSKWNLKLWEFFETACRSQLMFLYFFRCDTRFFRTTLMIIIIFSICFNTPTKLRERKKNSLLLVVI